MRLEPSRISTTFATLLFALACSPINTPTTARAPVIATFTAVPATISAGGFSTLQWVVVGATGVALSGVGAVTGTSTSVSPTMTTTYSLTATSDGGSTTATTTVTVQPKTASACGNGHLDPGEACDPSATPAVPGGRTCASLGDGFNGGTLSCDSMCHLVTSQCTTPAAAVITSFTATPPTIMAGENSTLAWMVTGATTVSLSGVGLVAGSSTLVTPAATTTYTLTATGSAGSVTANVTVTVEPAVATCGNGQVDPGEACDLSAATPIPAGTTCVGQGFTGGTLTCDSLCELVTSQCTTATVPVITSFTATPAAINAGASSTLAWTVSGATALSLSGIGSITGTSNNVSPAATTTFMLTASNTAGSATASATVMVTAAATMGATGPFATYFGGTGSGSLVGAAETQAVPQAQPQNIPFGTILFVTQVPVSGFSIVASSFSNHAADIGSAPRGGDLYLRYPDGTLRNLTQEAGYGQEGMQSTQSIAVRDPAVHWSATKALFSMVIGAPTHFAVDDYYWQLYEVTGLGLGETATITKVAGQPQGVDNVNAIYGTDGRIIFTSNLVPFDLGGQRLDEYETAPSVTGIWSLDQTSGDLKILFNSPSGAFDPMIDSFGRVLWTNWDHLQRDQQADTNDVLSTYHPVDCTDEKSTSGCVDLVANPTAGDAPPSIEVFPEPRVVQTDNPLDYSAHAFNQFFPWMTNEDGTGAETLNHAGAHEFGTAYQGPSFANDPTLTDISTVELDTMLHANTNYLTGFGGLFRLTEDPNTPGRYYWHFAPEFHSMNGGDLGYLDAAPTVNPQEMKLVLLTNTGIFPGEDTARDGHYRDALPLSDGTLVAAYTSQLQNDSDPLFAAAEATQAAELADGGMYGGTAAVGALYDYHLVQMTQPSVGSPFTAGTRLTTGINKSLTWYDPDDLVTFSGPLWELEPVEVRARTIPARHLEAPSSPTSSVFQETGVDPAAMQTWLAANNLALITSYDVTQRDVADTTQPYDLEVKDPITGTIGAKSVVGSHTPRDISYMQFLEGDALRAFRGYGATTPVGDARRVVGEYVTDTRLSNWLATNGAPIGSVTLGSDGSMAAFVPAQKPLSWQLLGPDGSSVVRERYWLTFAAGEIRTCTNCHGINVLSQTGTPPPSNEPAALRTLLTSWLSAH